MPPGPSRDLGVYGRASVETERPEWKLWQKSRQLIMIWAIIRGGGKWMNTFWTSVKLKFQGCWWIGCRVLDKSGQHVSKVIGWSNKKYRIRESHVWCRIFGKYLNYKWENYSPFYRIVNILVCFHLVIFLSSLLIVLGFFLCVCINIYTNI